MAKDCFWCSGMRHLGPLGAWFEAQYSECCKAHDLAYMQNTAQRAQGRPHLKERSEIDADFRNCLEDKGFPIVPVLAWAGVRALYWPSRILKKVFKGGIV